MTREKLLDIFDELHNEMKIYHGDVVLRMDVSNGMLRSGDKEMIIDKIRHLSYLLRNVTAHICTIGIANYVLFQV